MNALVALAEGEAEVLGVCDGVRDGVDSLLGARDGVSVGVGTAEADRDDVRRSWRPGMSAPASTRLLAASTCTNSAASTLPWCAAAGSVGFSWRSQIAAQQEAAARLSIATTAPHAAAVWTRITQPVPGCHIWSARNPAWRLCTAAGCAAGPGIGVVAGKTS